MRERNIAKNSIKKYLFMLGAVTVLMCGCNSVNEVAINNDDVKVEEVEERVIIVEDTEEEILQESSNDAEEVVDLVELEQIVVEENVVEEPITYDVPDFVGMSLADACSVLEENGIEKITALEEAGDIISDNMEYYEVVAQSIEVGKSIYLEMPVELVCKLKKEQVYEELVVSSEIKKGYELIYEIDGEVEDNLELANTYKKSFELGMGEHIIRFIKADDETVYAEVPFEIKNDSIIDIEVCEKKNEIEIIRAEVTEDYADRVVIVPNLIGVRTDFLADFMPENLFDTYSVMADKENVEPSNEWTIYEQNLSSEELHLRDKELILLCMPTNDYLMEKYGSLSIEEFEKTMEEEGYTYDYIKKNFYGSYKEEFEKKASEEKELWRIFSITDETTQSEKKISAELIYAGEVEMPNLVNEKLDVAKKKLVELGMDNFEINNPTTVTNPNMLIVTSQNIAAKKKISADSKIVLKVKKRILPKPTPTPTPKPTEPPKPSYTFADMNATKYAKSTVNVRNLPDKTGNKVGSLSQNEMVTVTGRCNETGWYRIKFNNGDAYVADAFLVDEKIVVVQEPPKETKSSEVTTNTGKNSANSNANTAVNEKKSVPATTGVTYIGNIRNMKLHRANCSGKLPKESNRQYFNSLEEAVAAGYTEAEQCKNCKPFR